MKDRKIAGLLDAQPEEGLRLATREYGGLAMHIVSGILGSACEDVQECVADVFIAIWRRRAEIDCEGGSLKGLIAAIARKTALNRRKKLFKDSAAVYDAGESADERDFVHELELKESAERIQQVICGLDEPTRSALILKYFLYYDNDEISRRLSLSKKQVENYLYQGKRKIKAIMEAEI